MPAPRFVTPSNGPCAMSDVTALNEEAQKVAAPEEKPGDKDSLAGFSRVLSAELDDIHARRNRGSAPVPPIVTRKPTTFEGADERLRDLRRKALDSDLVVLALSGGGIRSATFCL